MDRINNNVNKLNWDDLVAVNEILDEAVNLRASIPEIDNFILDYYESEEGKKSSTAKEMPELEKMSSYNEILLKNITSLKTRKLELTPEKKDQSLETSFKNHDAGVKLPKISLPNFSGEIEKWPEFIDLFTVTVDNNPSLSPVQKFQYLRSALREPASRVISAFLINDVNYSLALKTLKESYECKRVIVLTMVDKLFNFPPILRQSSTSLRNLVTIFKQILCGLETQGQRYPPNDAFILRLILNKLDKDTSYQWHIQLETKEVPHFMNLLSFIEKMANSLPQTSTSLYKSNFNTTKGINYQSVRENICPMCRETHKIVNCEGFCSKNPLERFDLVFKLGLCINCLSPRHIIKECREMSGCTLCQKRHHVLLHRDRDSPTQGPEQRSLNSRPLAQNYPQDNKGRNRNEVPQQQNTYFTKTKDESNTMVLLGTASIVVMDERGNSMICRVLLDSASDASYITRECVKKIGLRINNESAHSITGLGARSLSWSLGSVSLKLKSRIDKSREFSIRAFVLDKVSVNLPLYCVEKRDWTHLENLDLADPEFDKPGNIDMLLGADIYPYIECSSVINEARDKLTAKLTHFGWVLSGFCHGKIQEHRPHPTFLNIDESLARLWALEEYPDNFSIHNDPCEKHFNETFRRLESGQFQVRLPFKLDPKTLGNSRDRAVRRFIRLEQNFKKNKRLKLEYTRFIEELIYLNHMERVEKPLENKVSYYMPHHCVIREESLSTKLRVVFDCSMKTSTGFSLNDCLHTGPSLMQDLRKIIILFRLKRVAFCADIKMMYRMIKIAAEDRDFLRLLWRRECPEDIQVFRLTTLPFGLVSSPFIALRVLHQVAKECEEDYPDVAQLLRTSFYMDDLLAGADTCEEGIRLIRDLNRVLSSAGFHLDKWASNDEIIKKEIALYGEISKNIFDMKEDSAISTLGLKWNPATDDFRFGFLVNEDNNALGTKRRMLSQISKLFDPLGWISPITVRFKILFQRLWTLNIDWDDEIPPEYELYWREFIHQLPLLEELQIPRFVLSPFHSDKILIGYCDASEKAYAAVVYLALTDGNRIIRQNILMSRTRLAPLKPVSLPRLELCAAVLLANLMCYILNILPFSIKNIICRSDSRIVLSWINSEPHRWCTFVANRVATIQTTLPQAKWQHIEGKFNPADVASRGEAIKKLIISEVWWKGFVPEIMSERMTLNSEEESNLKIEEKTRISFFQSAKNKESCNDLFKERSSYWRTLRILAWVRRPFLVFRSNRPNRGHQQYSRKLLLPPEIRKARDLCIMWCQKETYFDELSALQRGQSLERKSKIYTLNPFLDESGILRVGGRLKYAPIPFEQKHPAILSNKHWFTLILVRHFHLTYFHAGQRLMINLLRQSYWIIRIRHLVRKVNRDCVDCFKINPRFEGQQMASLPLPRVTASETFYHCGVDYAGPLLIKTSSLRRAPTVKAYVAVFICFATKAVHLELVSSLTSESFLAALKRFIGRRGIPGHLYSDCGKNFQGANGELKRTYQQLVKFERESQDFSSSQLIKWHFNPPGAPHMGGLWEASVKSFKYHLHRISRNISFTFEELSTLLIQIEALMNSRPLCPTSDDPNSLEFLTPGHFLINRSLLALPERDVPSRPIMSLTRWQRVQTVKNHFWRIWKQEYLNTIMQRYKWTEAKNNLSINQLVLVQQPTPPSKWIVGRIMEVMPGPDKRVRVIKIKTAQGELLRPIHKVALFPFSQLSP